MPPAPRTRAPDAVHLAMPLRLAARPGRGSPGDAPAPPGMPSGYALPLGDTYGSARQARSGMCSPLRASLFYGTASSLTEGSGAGASPGRPSRPQQSQRTDIRRGGGKKLVCVKSIPGILAGGSGKDLILLKPFLRIWRVRVQKACFCKIHSLVFKKWEWKLPKTAKCTHMFIEIGSGNPKKLQKALSQERKKRVFFPKIVIFRSRMH